MTGTSMTSPATFGTIVTDCLNTTTGPDGAPQFMGINKTKNNVAIQMAGDIFQNVFHGTIFKRTKRKKTPMEMSVRV